HELLWCAFVVFRFLACGARKSGRSLSNGTGPRRGRSLTCLLQNLKVSSRLLHIFRNLIPQSLDGRKSDLITQPLQEMNFHFRVRRELQGMEIQQVTLNGKRFSPECRSSPHIGHRVKALLPDSSPGDVHAIFWYELLITA